MIETDVKRLKRQKKPALPPKTKRRCRVCKRKTTWVYNPRIKHSQCEECGCRNIEDKLVNYEGEIMEREEPKNSKNNKGYRDYPYLLKWLHKKVKCALLPGSGTIEGELIRVNQYEIVLTVEGEETVVFKHGIVTIKECKEDTNSSIEE